MRVYDIVRQTGLPKEVVYEFLRKNGVDFKQPSSNVDAALVKQLFESAVQQEMFTIKPKSTTIKEESLDYQDYANIHFDSEYVDVLIIPDSHASPTHSLERYEWLNRYIHMLKDSPHHKLGVVVEMGDFGDFSSLCSHSSLHEIAQTSLAEDIAVTQKACNILTKGLKNSNLLLLSIKGNHDNRIDRLKKASPHLAGLIPEDYTGHMAEGWVVIDYNTTFFLTLTLAVGAIPALASHTIALQHYFSQAGKPVVSGGAVAPAQTLLRKTASLGCSAAMGHTHTNDFKLETGIFGKERFALLCGVYNNHDEDYAKGDNRRWQRGVNLLRFWNHGKIDYSFINIKTLEDMFSC